MNINLVIQTDKNGYLIGDNIIYYFSTSSTSIDISSKEVSVMPKGIASSLDETGSCIRSSSSRINTDERRLIRVKAFLCSNNYIFKSDLSKKPLVSQRRSFSRVFGVAKDCYEICLQKCGLNIQKISYLELLKP
ncbi:unnamed protein product [Acanthoscelides obtectus]|uniref:Uncharacterized protein n=1 Tax=Acanthoscelides obtectus TaxID=200917 RepID=A0A9P0KAI3_ACAOB|nr:unnamed protein product [Acanthoscelides obtectus]CAK1655973.1 hypothetical protein AOBTE_LOCUS19483 [Acanthoscelides obtectus]